MPQDAAIDARHRPLRDLRISVTDRCNFRCRYCMPREVFGPSFEYLDKKHILSFEEIETLARVFVGLGVTKLRLTGGEPLVRRDVALLVRMLAGLDVDLAMTSNGSLLRQHAAALKASGLRRLTISVDSLRADRFERITDSRVPLGTVLDGIRAAEEHGFGSLKINTVVRRGFNEDEIVEMARHFGDRGHVVRFIEYMDVGESNGWRRQQVVPKHEILSRLADAFGLEPLEACHPGEVAGRYRLPKLGAQVGVIASVTEPFCGGCRRARLSAEGKLYTCLFSSEGHDLRAPLRAGCSDAELAQRIGDIWHARDDRYSELRATLPNSKRALRVEMSHIGG